jgi:hypothetical protein
MSEGNQVLVVKGYRSFAKTWKDGSWDISGMFHIQSFHQVTWAQIQMRFKEFAYSKKLYFQVAMICLIFSLKRNVKG